MPFVMLPFGRKGERRKMLEIAQWAQMVRGCKSQNLRKCVFRAVSNRALHAANFNTYRSPRFRVDGKALLAKTRKKASANFLD